MKKVLKILTVSLLAVLICLGTVACDKTKKWKGTTIANWGELISANGFVAETQYNVYFINGRGDNTVDNTFGIPVKGSLMCIKKTDLVNGDYDKAEIVIPKLFASKDFSSGLFIDGDYVYYGTTNLDKKSSGQVANDELVFAKTKLDGTGTEILFNAGSLSTEYRISKADGVVYFVYYDSNVNAVKSFDTSSNQTKTISIKDDKAMESLSDEVFMNTQNGISCVYSVTCYSEEYFEDKASQEDYSRPVAKYNKLYKVDNKGVASVVVDGTADNMTYAITYTDGVYLFFTQTDINGVAKTYGVRVDQLADKTQWREIDSTFTIGEEIVIETLEKAYMADKDKQLIYSTSLVKGQLSTRKILAKNVDITAIVKIDGDLCYYYNINAQIAKIQLNDSSAEGVAVTVDMASSAWYAPEFITVHGNDFLFYCDDSTLGNFYIGVTNISAITEENTVDKACQFIGQRTPEDQAQTVNVYVDKALAGSELTYTQNEDGTIVYEDAKKAVEVYEEVIKDSAVKDLIAQDYLTKIENLKATIDLSARYYKLKDYNTFDEMDDTQKAQFKADFENAKALHEQLAKDGKLSDIRALIPDSINLEFFYQEACEIEF